jgi:hypothetical protein
MQEDKGTLAVVSLAPDRYRLTCPQGMILFFFCKGEIRLQPGKKIEKGISTGRDIERS